MATFYLLDHSLKNAGGHHYDYAKHVLHVAERAGYQVVLATHRSFRPAGHLPAAWAVLPVYRYPTYARYAFCSGWKGGAIGTNGRLLTSEASLGGRSAGGWSELWGRPDRARRIRAFSQSCHAVFELHPLTDGDQVFIPTLSDFDLLGLSQYLRGESETLLADWHLQFHFNVLEGREPEYAAQSRRVYLLRRQFEAALSDLADHRLHFYATTEQLARQYNLLDVATFTPLPYPINEDFHPPQERPERGPLRITSAGAVRPEKGQRFLAELATELWQDCFATGRLQLAVQCKRGHVSKSPRRVISTPSKSQAAAHFGRVEELTNDPVAYLEHPLSAADYQKLIHHTDIGLLLYDSQRYYARHAGVLGEYLSAGVPVIVPAGCWLSEQITEAVQLHLDHLHAQATPPEQVAAPGTWPLPPDASDVLISFDWPQAHRPGTFLRIVAEQADQEQRLVGRAETILSLRTNGRPTRALFHLELDCRSLHLSWWDAYGAQQLCLGEPRVQALRGGRAAGGAFPAGQVGLIAAAPAQVPRLVREIMKHYAHYRQTARLFSRQWHQAHKPERTFQTLLSRLPGASLPRAARAA